MLQLVNLSNYKTDLELIQNSSVCLSEFLIANGLDGVEMMFCAPWDASVHREEWIHGVHLQFWSGWLDFWRGDHAELLRQFGTEENIITCYGGLRREDWLNRYRENIRLALQAGAGYLVFHAGHNRLEEIYDWQFAASDREVVEATIEVANALAADIPNDVALLFENLWWPGLRLLDRELVAQLFEQVRHPNTGIMLDTGHLMNTNQELKSEDDGVEYILSVIDGLGDCSRYIRGVHLHHSLSGEYVGRTRRRGREPVSFGEAMAHVMQIDQHLPFSTTQAGRIIERLQPDWLVHEFVQKSAEDWQAKLARQQQAIGCRG